jgi:Ca2+-transporting ATPase
MKLSQIDLLELIKLLNSNLDTGLTQAQVILNLAKYGVNSFPRPKRASYFKIFISQFANPLIYILLLAAVIIFFVGEHLDAFIISGVLLFNATLGAIQEGRTANIIDHLERLIKTEILVVRDGQRKIITDQELVVGDLVILQEGARVPADLRIITAQDLLIDEAILTGESQPVVKSSNHEQNILFQGTYITAGSGTAIVIAVGVNTQLGQLNKLVSTVEKDLPLQHELEKLSYWIIIFIVAVCLVLLLIGLFTGKPFAELLAMLTALFICVVPEGLPVVLTLVLVTGVYRMARRDVLVKKLRAVEVLGRIDLVLTDKTGTLTRNEMMVLECFDGQQLYKITGQGYFPTGEILDQQAKIVPQDHISPDSKLYQAGLAAALLSDAELEFVPEQQIFNLKGDPTEAALKIFAQKLNLNSAQLINNYKLKQRMAFNTQNRLQAGLYQLSSAELILVLGAPEKILELCDILPEDLIKLTKELAQLLASGLRVIGCAQKTGANFGELATELKNLKFVALFGIQDAIRDDARASIAAAQMAGIDVVMITGDHPETAVFVAKAVGILTPDNISQSNLAQNSLATLTSSQITTQVVTKNNSANNSKNLVLTGAEFAQLSAERKSLALDQVAVFARVSPQEKFEIVQLYQAKKRLVAVTGDGVNDAPALATANVGIAMGGIGTEIAKQAAELILLKDAFSGIVYAIEQGRHIFYTLKRVILYFFATNLGEVFVVLGALILSLPAPILPAQILWLNLVTDGFLDIALSMEPEEHDTLSYNWSASCKQLLTGQMFIKILYMASLMGLGSLIIFYLNYQQDLAYARTMTLLTMAMFQWFNAWNCRSDYKSVFTLGVFSNRWLLLATSVVLGLQVAVVYMPVLQKIFKTVPISGLDWLIVFCISITVFIAEECRKLFVNKFNQAPRA